MAKAECSAKEGKIPSNGGLEHRFVSRGIQLNVHVGRRSAVGSGAVAEGAGVVDFVLPLTKLAMSSPVSARAVGSVAALSAAAPPGYAGPSPGQCRVLERRKREHPPRATLRLRRAARSALCAITVWGAASARGAVPCGRSGR
jgi:hypothetical protein